jgi:hypothetical protein
LIIIITKDLKKKKRILTARNAIIGWQKQIIYLVKFIYRELKCWIANLLCVSIYIYISNQLPNMLSWVPLHSTVFSFYFYFIVHTKFIKHLHRSIVIHYSPSTLKFSILLSIQYIYIYIYIYIYHFISFFIRWVQLNHQLFLSLLTNWYFS